MKFFKPAAYDPATEMTLYRDTIDVVEPLEPGMWSEDPAQRQRTQDMLAEERRLMFLDEFMQTRGFSPQYRVHVRWTGEPQWVQNVPQAPHGGVEGTYEIRVTFDVVDPATIDSLVLEVLQKSTITI